MIKGITEDEEKIIKSILSAYTNEAKFFYYGSRTKGTFEKTSDLDILIKGDTAFPYEKLEIIKFLFDKSNLPYIVNFTDYNRIEDSFYNFIKKDLVEIF